MNKTICSLALVGASVAVAVGCSDKHEDFGTFVPLPESGWAYGDTVNIRAEGLDSLKAGQRRVLKVGVRHNNDYEYRNVILEVSFRAGNRIYRDTVDMELADVYGAWLGSGVGPVYQAESTVSLSLPIPDSTQVSLRHVMRVDTLHGIERIGIIIDKP